MLCEDLLAHGPGLFRRAYPGTYYFLVRRLSLVWGACFRLLDQRWFYGVVKPLRRAWNLVLARGFIQWLKQQAPDLIVTTHFFPAEVCGSGKRSGWLKAPLVVVVTDYYPHQFWITSEAEATVVATDATAAECRKRGLPAARIHVTGIPIARGFDAVMDRSAVERTLRLDSARKTILVTSGGNTVGPFEPVVHALCRLEATLPGRIQLIVVCGDNTAVAERLTRTTQACRMPVRVFGFVETIPELMGACDLVVAKAGGLTVTESLARGLPLVLYHAIPGQELFNARYLVEHGAALLARGPDDVAQAVRRYLEDPHHMRTLRDAAASLSRPHAAEVIVESVVKPLVSHAAA